MPHEVLVVGSVRSSYGARDGALSKRHPVDLASEVMAGLMTSLELEPSCVHQMVLGCVSGVGAQGRNIARHAVLASGWSTEIPGTTVDQQGASGAEAIRLSAGMIGAGICDVVLAGGIEIMSAVPSGATLAIPGAGKPYGPRMKELHGSLLVPDGMATEALATEYGISRTDLDAWVLESHRRASNGALKPTRVPVATGNGSPGDPMLTSDELIRGDLSSEDLAATPPTFVENGVITAMNTAPAADGAAVTLLTSERGAQNVGLSPIGRILSFTSYGERRISGWGSGVPATTRALEKAGLKLGDIDVIEVHEATALSAIE